MNLYLITDKNLNLLYMPGVAKPPNPTSRSLAIPGICYISIILMYIFCK
jgi:hypothetical protein